MPHELFGDVVHASTTTGGRKWHTLPLSIATHSLIVGTAVVVSLFSIDTLPTVPKYMPPYMAATLKTPEVPQASAAARPLPAGPAQPSFNPNAAPVEAPNGVKPDSGIVRDPDLSDAGAVPGGLPNGVQGAGVSVLPEAPPPVPSAPSIPIRLSAGVTPPVKIKDVRPAYTELALRAGAQGTVVIEAIISTDGKVINARVLRSVPLLDEAALDAVRQWVYTPGRLNAQPVAIIMTVTVTFALQR